MYLYTRRSRIIPMSDQSALTRYSWPKGVNTAGCLEPVKAESQVVPEILRGPASLPFLSGL